MTTFVVEWRRVWLARGWVAPGADRANETMAGQLYRRDGKTRFVNYTRSMALKRNSIATNSSGSDCT